MALRIFADQPQHAEISRSFDDSSTLEQEREGILLLLIHSATVGSYPSDQMASLKFREN